jgi:hypothetical protein
MRVPDFVLKCVGFLGDVVKGCETDDLNPQATAFFVTVRSSVQNAGSYCYVVTARHAANNLKGPLWLSANTPSGKVLLEPDFQERHWYLHPTDPTADVAVTPFGVTPDMDLVTVSCGAMLTPQKIRDYEIGVGDEVFFPGLFYDIPGSTQNTPILRHGNLAMFPADQVQVDLQNGKSEFMDVYLVEARSIKGLSGSPVFVRESVAVCGRNNKGMWVKAKAVSRFHLLGLMSGHWDTATHPKGVNAGIAFVVPAHKILETLDHPALLEMRIENENKLLRRIPL